MEARGDYEVNLLPVDAVSVTRFRVILRRKLLRPARSLAYRLSGIIQ